MPPDKRSFVSAVDNFTSRTYTCIGPTIDPSLVSFPSHFVVCIIGASEGIGSHVAYAYARAKASGIVIASRKLLDLESVAADVHEINPKAKVEVVECDVISSSSVAILASRIRTLFGRLDVVVSAFGYSGPVSLRVTDSNPENVQKAFDVNVIGLYHVAHHLIPILLSSSNGAKAFLAVGSIAGSILTGPIANFAYCTSKMAQARLVESLAEQYRSEGLLAVSIHPGAVLTPTADISTPDVFRKHLTDDVGLCGAACVWLTNTMGTKEKMWLTGRLISATWDFVEVESRKEEIIERDLLTWRMVTE